MDRSHMNIFLEDELPLLIGLPLLFKIQMWLLHDKTPAYFNLFVGEDLN